MGIVPEESTLYPELDGFENLCFCGALFFLALANVKQNWIL
jgi:ABC-2 type transport system ATP-binding protein